MVVLGLGNPGDEYTDTRHNCGFKVVEYLGEKTGIELQKKFFKKYIYGKGVFKGKDIFLIKPLTFMNCCNLYTIFGTFNLKLNWVF